jgi:hypothetical protein
MNRKILLSTAAGLVAGVLAAGPALAEVTVLATIDKTKTVNVFESLTILKFIEISVDATFTLNGVAEADAIMNVVNEDNDVIGLDVPEDPDDPTGFVDTELTGFALLISGLNDGTGVMGFNQSVGNMVNQGNAVSVAAIANDRFAVIDAQAEADQVNRNNTVDDQQLIGDVDLADPDLAAALLGLANKVALILDSINRNNGIVDMNQDAGNMNNQNNADAIGIAFGGVLALSEAALGQVNSGNRVTETETIKSGLIKDSINTNNGIVKVNQATGNMNNQANNVSFAALTASATISTPTF